MRATSPEVIKQHLSVIPEGVAISRSFGSFGGGEQIVLQSNEAGYIPRIGPTPRYFENWKKIKGASDTLPRNTVCRYKKLELEGENGLAVSIPCAKDSYDIGYVIDTRDDTPTKLWLARAVLDAVNGADTPDPKELERIHIERATRIAMRASTRFRTTSQY